MKTTTAQSAWLVSCLALVALPTSALAKEPSHPDPELLFEPSDQCLACHNGLVSHSGDDVSIGTRWRSTIMAHAATDPYWQAGVRRETLEHPKAKEAIEDKCSTCHMPMARFASRERGQKGSVLARLERGLIDTGTRDGVLAKDGVSCSACHQLDPGNFGKPESFGGGFEVDTRTAPGQRKVYGPFDIADGTARLMSSATGFVPTKSEHLKRSEMCATCHTLYTHALDENGHEKAELAEQAPYLEWLHSDYKDAMSCQSCHMAERKDEVAISSVLGKPRPGVFEHLFKGGNFLFLRLLASNRALLGVEALPGELEENLRTTTANLTSSAASLAIDVGNATLADGRLRLPVVVENLAGHKLPTAYPSRRVWLHVTVKDRHGAVVFDSGALRDDGSIEGNDNDADPARFEPHYAEVSEPSQVQIYESIMGTLNGQVTTGLLSAATYLKDNRVPPVGFDKATADPDVAVAGSALDDESFEGGRDTTFYSIEATTDQGPFAVTAELWYQPIAFRWAQNLAQIAAPEPERFVELYSAVPGRDTALRLAAVTALVGQ